MKNSTFTYVHSLQGIRPTIPKDTHPKLAELLQKCWHRDPAERPDFSEILEILQGLSKEVTPPVYHMSRYSSCDFPSVTRKVGP
jgi:hypothetical protein